MKRHAESHLDHHLTDAQIAHVFERFADRAAFFIETIELPEELGTVPCGLYGPSMGDAPVLEAEQAKRGARAWTSRLVDRPARPTRQLTVIGGPHDGEPCILYTAFGGPSTPQEPGDIRRQLEALEEQRRELHRAGKGHDTHPEHVAIYAKIEAMLIKRAESDAFWSTHALAK